MAPDARARRNHDELFPGHVSTLAVTDPEMIETFDNFAFGEVQAHGNRDARTRPMVQLASMIACQSLREYRVMLGAALTVGVTPGEKHWHGAAAATAMTHIAIVEELDG
jgi:4-carboxymuconolactone decarboxylase